MSSLCTVVSLRAEIDPTSVGRRREARGGGEISQFLPDDVECFAVYNTPKSFQARRECIMRTYEYLLPARVLGAERARLGRDRAIGDVLRRLSAFVGAHPFHNYTRRSQYTREAKSNFGPKLRDARGKLAWRGQEGATMDDASEDERAGEDDEDEEEERMASRTVRDATADDDGFPRHIGDRSRGTYWLFETDHDDKIGPSHFRKIHDFVAGDDVERMEIVSEDGSTSLSEPFIRVSVRGESFMLYQIRKMIATAVAVSLGHCPLEFLPASLSRRGRRRCPWRRRRRSTCTTSSL